MINHKNKTYSKPEFSPVEGLQDNVCSGSVNIEDINEETIDWN